MSYNLDKFKAGLKELNIVLDQNQTEQFLNYYEMLIQWNKVRILPALPNLIRWWKNIFWTACVL